MKRLWAISAATVIVLGAIIFAILFSRTDRLVSPTSFDVDPTSPAENTATAFPVQGDTIGLTVSPPPVSMDAQITPTLLPRNTPTYYSFQSTYDILKLIPIDSFLTLLRSTSNGLCFTSQSVDKPVFVKNVEPGGQDYYLVVFRLNGEICAIASFFVVKDGQGAFGSWAGGFSSTNFPPITSDEARRLAEKAGFEIEGEPRLVYKSCLEEGCYQTNPPWEMTTTDGQKLYVVYDHFPSMNAPVILVNDEVLKPAEAATPVFHTFHSTGDILILVSNELQSERADPFSGACLTADSPGTPLFVTSLEHDQSDYYLIPYRNGGLVCLYAIFHVPQSGTGYFGGWLGPPGTPPHDLRITSAEAVQIVTQAGFAIKREPRLVYKEGFRFSGENNPVWEVITADRQTFYVVDNLFAPMLVRTIPATSLADHSQATEAILKRIEADPTFSALKNDHDYGSCVRANLPGTPLLVKSLEQGHSDYYLIPYNKDGQLCGYATFRVHQDGAGDFQMYSVGGPSEPKNGVSKYIFDCLQITSDEARSLVQKAGFNVTGEPSLVYQSCLYGCSEINPLWEVPTADDQTLYVVYDYYEDVDGPVIITPNGVITQNGIIKP